MGRDDLGPIAQYNSLMDPNLKAHYSKERIRSHLRQSGLINRYGEIIPDEIWKKRLITKERMEQASRLVASKIVQHAVEIKNLERSEMRKQLEFVSKRELVRRVRGESLQSRQLPLLWSRAEGRSDSRSASANHDNYSDTRGDDDFRFLTPKMSRPRSTASRHSRGKRGKSGKRASSAKGARRPFSATNKPRVEPVVLTMVYYGKGINIPFDKQMFESKDEISIYQQHCGGENLLVYSGLHEKGDRFSFISKRHKEYPFSLTIYINSTYDFRISTCCEYRHNLNKRIGGKTGRFAITNVTGDHPCIKCMLERSKKKEEKPTKPEEHEIEVIADDPKNNRRSPDEDFNKKLEITVNHEDTSKTNDGNSSWDDDDDDKDIWSVRVVTSDLAGNTLEGTDARVYVVLMGNKESGKIWLNSKTAVGNSRKADLFEAGHVDEFKVKAPRNVGKLRTLRVGHDNTGAKEAAWHLDRIELTNVETKESYLFACGRWLGVRKDDGKIERTLQPVASSGDNDDKQWLVRVITSDGAMNGTDSRVYVQLLGEKRESARYWLDKQCVKTKNKNLFEEGQMDEFVISVPSDLGRVERIRVGHDNAGMAPGWHLDRIDLVNKTDTLTFICKRWLSKDEDDGKVERILVQKGVNKTPSPKPPLPPSKAPTPPSSGRSSSGEDVYSMQASRERKSKRYSTIDIIDEFGSRGRVEREESSRASTTSKASSSKGTAKKPPLAKPPARRSSTSSSSSCSEDERHRSERLSGKKIEQRINSQLSSKRSSVTSIESSSRSSVNKRIDEVPPPESWTVKVFTSDLAGKSMEGTDANVYIVVFGQGDKKSAKCWLNKSNAVLRNRDLFEAGQTDEFTVKLPANLGRIERVQVGHDNAGMGAGWHLNKIELVSPKSEYYAFPCNRWLATNEDDGKTERMLYLAKEAPSRNKPFGSESSIENSATRDSQPVKTGLPAQKAQERRDSPQPDAIWKVHVFTSDLKSTSGEGTDSKVYLSFITKKGKETQKYWLDKSNVTSRFKDLFEAGQTDEFAIRVPTSFTRIEKIRIGHDSTGFGAGWHLNKVELISPKGAFYSFACGRWLAKNEGDGKIERVLDATVEPPVTPFESSSSSSASSFDDANSSAKLKAKNNASTARKNDKDNDSDNSLSSVSSLSSISHKSPVQKNAPTTTLTATTTSDNKKKSNAGSDESDLENWGKW